MTEKEALLKELLCSEYEKYIPKSFFLSSDEHINMLEAHHKLTTMKRYVAIYEDILNALWKEQIDNAIEAYKNRVNSNIEEP